MAIRIQLRRDTAVNWTSINPILASGEPGYETNSIKYKIGDGVTDWNSLPYFSRAHDELTNLDYASAGHTGFASTAALTSTSGVLQSGISTNAGGIITNASDIADNTTLIATTSGTLQTNIDANTALITTISGKLDDHDEMNNLDYASAGHTGFQPAGDYITDVEMTTISGDITAQIPTDFYTQGEVDTISGSITDQIITNHSELDELDYASAGHTGFQPAGDYATNTDLTNVSGSVDTNTADILTNTGDISTNTDDITSNAASIAVVSGTADTNASNIADNTTLITTTSGSLQNEIDTKSSTLLELTDTPVAYDNEKYLRSTASGTEWATVSSGIELAGADTEIQFNDNGVMGADSNFTWDKATQRLAVIGDIQTDSSVTNTFVGTDVAGAGNLTGTGNVGVGRQVLHDASTGFYNVGVGYSALSSNTIGTENVAIGSFTGATNVSGIQNVFIGYGAGFFETGSERLYITNSPSGNPLIYGEFDNGLLRVNGDFDITGDLTVDGTSPFATTEDLATTSGTLQTQIDSQAEKPWVTVSGTHTVTTGGQNIFTDSTAGAFTITMYDNPEEGQRTTFMDKGGYSTTNNVTISGGAEKFNGENQYLYLNENYGSFTLIYGDTNSGWMSTTFPAFMTLDQA